MLNRLLIFLAVSITLYSSMVYSKGYENAVKIFDTNNTITDKSMSGDRSPKLHTKAGYLYTDRNNYGYTSLYFLENNTTVPVEVNIPVSNKLKSNSSGRTVLKKLAEDLIVYHLEISDDVFYFDLSSKSLKKWEPYYNLKRAELFDGYKDPNYNQSIMLAINWISILDNGFVVFSESGLVYSYDIDNDSLLRISEGVSGYNNLVQNSGKYIYFELDGIVYKTNGIDTNVIINESGSQSFVYRDNGDIVSRNQYYSPVSDEINVNAFLVLFENNSSGTGKAIDSLYVVNDNVTHEVKVKDGYKFSIASGVVSSENEFSFIIQKPVNVYYNKYEVQHCEIKSSVVVCDYIEIFPEIHHGLYYVTLFYFSKGKLLVSGEYEGKNKVVDSKLITIDLNDKEIVKVDVNNVENIKIKILAKSNREIFILTTSVFGVQHVLYKYNIGSNILNEIGGLNKSDFGHESLVHNGELYNISNGLYKLNENSKLFSLIFKSNYGRETSDLNRNGMHGINKIKSGVVSSSTITPADNQVEYHVNGNFIIDNNLDKTTIYEGLISSWVRTAEGFVFVSDKTVYKFNNGQVRELYQYSDSSEVKLFTALSYSYHKVLFDSSASNNSGYLLDVNTGGILPILTPEIEGYMVSRPIQCGNGAIYKWSNSSNEVSVWKTDGISNVQVTGLSSKYSYEFISANYNNDSNEVVFINYDNSTPAQPSILSLNCTDLSVSEVLKSENVGNAIVRMNKNERGDIFFTVTSDLRNDIYFINNKDLSLQHIFSSENFNQIVNETHLIHRTINGFFYLNSYAFKDKKLIAIPSSINEPNILNGNECVSDIEDPKGWIVCDITVRNSNGASEEILKIYDSSSSEYSYVNLSYLQPNSNISNLTYSNGRYFFNATIISLGHELLALDQNCFYELHSGADSCAIPLPNSTPRFFEQEMESYYQSQYVYFPIRAVDEELNILTYKISNQTGNWLSISNDGVVTGTVPANNPIGSYSFTVDISDGTSEVSRDFEFDILKWTVNSEPEKPTEPPVSEGQEKGGGSMSISILLLLYLLSFYNRKIRLTKI